MKAILSLTVFSCLFLSACAVVDNFGERAININKEAEEVQNAGLLLNVLRASSGYPLQFTGLTQVAGGGSAQLTVGLDIPFGRGTLNPFVAKPSATGTATSQNFTVGILDAQEFVNGILSPIDVNTIDLYVQKGFDRRDILNLLIGSVRVRSAEGSEVYFNDVKKPDFAAFQTFLDQLIEVLKLNTEPAIVNKTVMFLSESDLKRPEVMAEILRSGLKISAVPAGEKLPKSDQDFLNYRGIGPTSAFRIIKSVEGRRFCFDNETLSDDQEKFLCKHAKTAALGANAQLPSVNQFSNTIAPSLKKDEVMKQVTTFNAKIDAQVHIERKGSVTLDLSKVDAIEFNLRSTSDVFKFLGDIFSEKSMLEKNHPSTARLLVISDSNIPSPVLTSVNYRGTTYYVPGKLDAANRSGITLSILSQLVSLKKSVKDLPTTNIITVLGN